MQSPDALQPLSDPRHVELLHRRPRILPDGVAARQVVHRDREVNAMDMKGQELCLELLATRQPVASDLRFVASALKIVTDLERIGDLATNIANETIRLDGKPTLKPLVDIPVMAGLCIDMIKEAFLAISEKNSPRAKNVIGRDRDIDDLNIQIYRELISYMLENPHTIGQSLGLIMVSKALERIGDHATNVAERAVYYIEGEDIRHQE